MVHTDHNLQPQDCQEAPTQGCVVSVWLVLMESLLALTGGILRRTAQFHRRIPQILSSDRYHRTPSGRPPGVPNRLLVLFFFFPAGLPQLTPRLAIPMPVLTTGTRSA